VQAGGQLQNLLGSTVAVSGGLASSQLDAALVTSRPALRTGQAVRRAVEAAKIPGLTDFDEFYSDDLHLSPKGRWFVANVVAALPRPRVPGRQDVRPELGSDQGAGEGAPGDRAGRGQQLRARGVKGLKN
jgi:hypothetical protein